jgi:hypothetical protein
VDVWSNPPGLAGYVEKRVLQGHAKDADDYYRQIKATLRTAKKMNVSADPKYPLVGFMAGYWSVILTHDGLIKTAYGFESGMKTFTENKTDKGYNSMFKFLSLEK